MSERIVNFGFFFADLHTSRRATLFEKRKQLLNGNIHCCDYCDMERTLLGHSLEKEGSFLSGIRQKQNTRRSGKYIRIYAQTYNGI